MLPRARYQLMIYYCVPQAIDTINDTAVLERVSRILSLLDEAREAVSTIPLLPHSSGFLSLCLPGLPRRHPPGDLSDSGRVGRGAGGLWEPPGDDDLDGATSKPWLGCMGEIILVPPVSPTGIQSHVHTPHCNHRREPSGDLWAAALAGNVSVLRSTLAAGASTEEVEEEVRLTQFRAIAGDACVYATSNSVPHFRTTRLSFLCRRVRVPCPLQQRVAIWRPLSRCLRRGLR